MNRKISFLLAAILSLPISAQQQTTTSPEKDSLATLRANVHLVVLDVVALDDHGHPAADLNRDDFVVLEDGKAQQIKQFENRVASGVQPSAPQPATPAGPGEYKNVPATVPNAVNIVLLDMLNTQTRDQGEARRHLISFLRAMPKGRQVALYGLDTKLHLIQNFTGDSDTLIAAAEKALNAKQSALLDSDAQKNADGELVDDIKNAAFNPDVAARVAGFMKTTETAKTDQRVGLTLFSLQQIARSVAGVPGRKNLIWLSAGFPLNLEVDLEASSTGGLISEPERNYREAVERTTAALAEAQIAVYPVDSKGVIIGGVDVSVGGRGTFDMDRSGTIGDVMSAQTTQYSAIHESMDLLAKNTGGQAFYNGNDLQGSIARSMDLGSSYYVLAYTPTNTDWNGKLRKIEVKVQGKKIKLFFRRSYYALPDKHYTLPELERNLVSSMDPEIADSTMLSVGVKLSPGSKGPNSITLEYDLDRSQYQFVDGDAKQKVAMIDLAITGWDKHGKAAGTFGQSLKLPQADSSQTRIAFRQQLVLRPNTARIRVGVMDRSTGRIGTVEVLSLPFASEAEVKTDIKPEAKP